MIPIILKFTLENDSFCNKNNLPFNSKKVERSSGVTHLRVKVSRWPIKPGPTQPRPWVGIYLMLVMGWRQKVGQATGPGCERSLECENERTKFGSSREGFPHRHRTRKGTLLYVHCTAKASDRGSSHTGRICLWFYVAVKSCNKLKMLGRSAKEVGT